MKRLMILVLGLSLIFMVGCFHKQNSNNDNLWDNMGGGLEGSNTDESKLSKNDIIFAQRRESTVHMFYAIRRN